MVMASSFWSQLLCNNTKEPSPAAALSAHILQVKAWMVASVTQAGSAAPITRPNNSLSKQNTTHAMLPVPPK
jgi:hypothetical protein